MTWTRRGFLKNAGFAGLAARVGWKPPATAFPARAFGLAAVYESPGGALSGHLAPNSVHQVSESDGWFVMEHGYVAQTEMQPIAPYTPPQIQTPAAAPFWAELIAPSSVIRAWADGRAPALATLGFGAVVKVIGCLTDDRGHAWFETREGGWLTTAHFGQALTPGPSPKGEGSNASLRINFRQRTLRLYVDRRLVVQSPYYGGQGISRRPTRLTAEQPGGASGIPWLMRLESGAAMHGAYWHNQFGLPGGETGVELPIGAAKAIYVVIDGIGCGVQFDG